MLRLKDERHVELDDFDEELDARPAARRADDITRDDAFPADDDEGPGLQEDRAGVSTLRGLGIAAAAFVPTFLAAFLGLPYLLAPATPVRTPDQPPSVTSVLPGGGPDSATTPSASETLRGRLGSGATSAAVPWAPGPSAGVPDDPTLGKREPVSPDLTGPPAAEPAPAPGESSQPADQAPPAAAEPSPPPATSLPPVSPRGPEPARIATPSGPAPERRPDPEPRPTADTDSRAPAGAHRPPGDWTPAAAFAGREAAGRLAASIERQGYPVEIRQDGSAARPWVVWIGSRPSGGARRR